MDQQQLRGISYISVASSNILPSPFFAPRVPRNSIWEREVVNETNCRQEIVPNEESQSQPPTSRSLSASDQASLSDDPSDAWFNAAGILLSLKHAAAERNTWMGNDGLGATPWRLSENDTAASSHPQKANLPQPANGFSSANNTSSPFLNFNDVADPHDPESLQEFYSAHLNEPDTNERCHLVSEDPKAKTNKCRLCDKKYARPSTLQTHMRTHSGEKPYRCHICLKSFSQDANLTAHLRIHSGEKPFKCSVCDRRFAQSSSVTTHMRTHTGERPYRCKICSRGFADSSTLTKHLRTHTGEKPYKCTICGLKFSQSGNLNRHMRIHASGK